MPARARMMPISHGTACSAVVGLRRLPSRFGSQVSDGPESGGPPKAVVAAAVSTSDLVAGLVLGLELRLGLRIGDGFRLRFVDGWGRGQFDPRRLGGDGGRGHLSVHRAPAREPIPAPVRGGWGRSQLILDLLRGDRGRGHLSSIGLRLGLGRRPSRPPARVQARPRPLAPAPGARPLAPARVRPLGSASTGCSTLRGPLRGRLLRLRQGIGPRGLALERGFDRRRLVWRRRAARWDGPGIVLGRGGGRREGISLRRLRIEGLGVRPLPLQGFDGWLVRWQRLEGIGVVGPARSWLWCPVLLQVALGPVRAVFRRSGVAHAAPPAGRLIRRMIASRPATGHSVGPRDANGSSARSGQLTAPRCTTAPRPSHRRGLTPNWSEPTRTSASQA